jgi:hypothetical protein
VAVLYNNQGEVINFEIGSRSKPNNPTIDFELCVDTQKQSVERFDLKAWGM